MSLLEKLPTEILAEVAAFLDSETLLSFRLVNTNISNSIHHVIVRRFFRDRVVLINFKSLSILRQISLSEKYRASIVSLNVDIHHIPETQYDFEIRYIKSLARGIMESNPSHYTKLLKDQKWLTKSGQAAAHLALALKDLPNCVTVTISDLLYDLDLDFQISKKNPLLTTGMSLSTSLDFVEQLVSTTMAAINASGRMLEAFHINPLIDGIPIQQLPKLSPDQLGPPFSSLSFMSLGLEFDRFKNNQEIYLFDWIKLFPSLKMLELRFSPRLKQDQFSPIGRGLHINHTATLVLSFVDCHYDDLAAVFKNHRDTLRGITLDALDITGCTKPWRSILELIRDETLIDDMDLIHCMSNERHLSFEAQPEIEKISISTESHKNFKEELDVVIASQFSDC